jgi:hypothetical protein
MANIGRILSMIEMDAWHHLTSCHVIKHRVGTSKAGARLENRDWSLYIVNTPTGHFLAICMVGVDCIYTCWANTAAVQNNKNKNKNWESAT